MRQAAPRVEPDRTRLHLSCGLVLLCSGPLAACGVSRDVGALGGACRDAGCEAALDAGSAGDGWSPIGEPQYPDYDDQAFQGLARGIAGEWRGVAAGLEMISSPFELDFRPEGTVGAGSFSVRCIEASNCAPFDGLSSGTYRLSYADAEEGGQGELTWSGVLPLPQWVSFQFRSLLLPQEQTVLFFIIDVPALGSFQIVARRADAADAGSGESGADGGAGDAGPEPAL